MITSQLLESILKDASYLAPEVYLTFVVLLFVLITPFVKSSIDRFGGLLGLLCILPALYLTYRQFILIDNVSVSLFGGLLLLDGQAVFFKFSFLFSLILFYLHHLTLNSRIDDERTGEYHFMIFSSLLAMQFVVMSNNILMAFIALETLSLSNYALVLFGKGRNRPEAALKYIIFGSVITSVMLFGAAILFSLYGSLEFDIFFSQSSIAPSVVTITFSFLFLVGALFKLGVAPLHIWVPDIYQNIPYKLAAFFSFGPKVAGMALLLNILKGSFIDTLSDSVVLIVGVVCLFSLFTANLAALSQKNAKRLLAYSSIAHSGFLLVGVVAFGEVGFSSIMFYTVSYLILNFSGFYVVELLSKQSASDRIEDFSGLGLRSPLLGIVTLTIMIGLTGLPPTIGFIGKLWLFTALYNHLSFEFNTIYFWVLFLGLINIVIALFYYLKIPFFIFFKKGRSDLKVRLNWQQTGLVTLMTATIIVLFFINDFIFDFILLLNI